VSPNELSVVAEEEMKAALTLSWRELSKIIPWGDTYMAQTPGGAEVEVERGYLWAGADGGGILCEVVVRPVPASDVGAVRVSSVIQK
jgi:hypothetical protein